MASMAKLDLGSAPLTPLMIRLSLPSITAYLINILYNVVDRIYIGHIPGGSSLALTGVGVCLPVITLISAFSAFAGGGGAPLAAIELGKTEWDDAAHKRAEAILANAFLMMLIFAVALMAFFMITKEGVLRAFGASDQTLPFADAYLSVYLCGTLAVELSIGLNPFISAQGKAKTAMFSVLIGAVLNIILDPIFIFAFGWGVRGAAWATIISQAASALWILAFLTSTRSVLRLSVRTLRPSLSVCAKIASLGVSPFIMQATESAIFVVFNSGLQKYGGDICVAAMTIMQSLMQLCHYPLQGFTMGIQPIVSYNFGAKNIPRVKATIRRSCLVCFVFSLAAFVLTRAFPAFFVGFFTTDEQLRELASRTLPVYFGAMWIFGIQMSAQSTFVALGKAKTSLFIALLRKVILLIPLALILPVFTGVSGIFAAEPIASTTSALTAGALLLVCYRRMRAA